MDKANEKASRAVYAQNNTGRDASTIDLHGLYVEEATKRARQSIQQAKREVCSCQKHSSALTLIEPVCRCLL